MTFEDVKIELPDEKNVNNILENYLNQPVTMGIRPEALYTDESRPANKCLGKFKAEVELTELMGAETY